MRAADHELARRVDVQRERVVHQVGGQHGRQHVLADVGLDLLAGRAGVVLGRDHDRVDALDGPVVVGVLDGHLALGVGAEVGHVLAGLADLGQPGHEPVREHERERHQRGVVLARGVAEHHALVAGPLRLVHAGALVDALRDVGRLLVDRDQHAARPGVELQGGVGVADLLDGAPDDLLDVHVGPARDLARDHHEPRRAQRLDGAPAGGVAGQEGVEERVGDLVGDLVGVAFGDRLGREERGHAEGQKGEAGKVGGAVHGRPASAFRRGVFCESVPPPRRAGGRGPRSAPPPAA